MALCGLIAGLLVGTGMNAEAITIAHGGNSVDIDFVDIGNAGNTGDTAVAGYGAVAYDYSIGKFEVTADQWASGDQPPIPMSATQAIGAAHNPPQVQAGMKRRSSPTG